MVILLWELVEIQPHSMVPCDLSWIWYLYRAIIVDEDVFFIQILRLVKGSTTLGRWLHSYAIFGELVEEVVSSLAILGDCTQLTR